MSDIRYYGWTNFCFACVSTVDDYFCDVKKVLHECNDEQEQEQEEEQDV